MNIPPVTKSIRVREPHENAFRRFTRGIGEWWPLATHSIDPETTETCVFEERVGGRIYERHRDGSEAEWGRVTVWEPPTRVAFTWHPGRPASTAQEIEVVFTPTENGTRVELTHRGWERYGPGAQKSRDEYSPGWDFVLSHYTQP